MRADADELTKASFIFGAFGMRRPVREVVGFRGRSNIVAPRYGPPRKWSVRVTSRFATFQLLHIRSREPLYLWFWRRVILSAAIAS